MARVINGPEGTIEEPTPRDRLGEALRTRRMAVLLSLVLVIAPSLLAKRITPFLGIPVALLCIWLLFRVSRQGWPDLGFRRPRSWLPTAAVGVAAALFLEALAVFVIVPLLLRFDIPLPDYSQFEAIRGNIPLLLGFLAVSWTTAGFGEEIIWRGFLMRRVAWLLGDGKAAWLLSLGLTSVAFGLLHLYQGTLGVLMTGSAGLILGAVYMLTGRNLWASIIAHGTTDTLSFILLYSGVLESLT